MEKRDLKADLELCNRASGESWKQASDIGYPYTIMDETFENVMAVYCTGDDAQFIAQAREGWPHAIERAIRAETLLRDILPMAMWESCMYIGHPDANPTTHCCDWNEFVERIKEVLGNDKVHAGRQSMGAKDY